MRARARIYNIAYRADYAVSPDSLAGSIFVGNGEQIPFPKYEPYYTEDGVCFIYQQYEIACYAAGRPTFTLPVKAE